MSDKFTLEFEQRAWKWQHCQQYRYNEDGICRKVDDYDTIPSVSGNCEGCPYNF